jgi:hypothetical protein
MFCDDAAYTRRAHDTQLMRPHTASRGRISRTNLLSKGGRACGMTRKVKLTLNKTVG